MNSKYFKLFVKIFIVFLLYDSVIALYDKGINILFVSVVARQIFPDIIWSGSVCLGLYVLIKSAKNISGRKDKSLVQTGVLYVRGNLDDVVCNSVNLINKVSFLRNVNIDKGIGVITAITKKSWKCFGEDLEISFSQYEDKVKIVVVSMPHNEDVIYDYGKNKENVDYMVDYLKKSELFGTNGALG